MKEVRNPPPLFPRGGEEAQSAAPSSLRSFGVSKPVVTSSLRDGRVEMDTNPVENATRHHTVGREAALTTIADAGFAKSTTAAAPTSRPRACACDASLPSDGSPWTGFPAVIGTMKALRLPDPHPSGLLFRRSVPQSACAFVSAFRAPVGQQAWPSGRGVLGQPVHPPFPASSLRTGQGLPGFLASLPVALRRSPTPDDPLRLADFGASGAVPTLSRMKASTMLFRGSIASLHHPQCTLHDMRCRTPCNTRFRLADCAFAGREANPLARNEGFLAHPFPPFQDFAWRYDKQDESRPLRIGARS